MCVDTLSALDALSFNPPRRKPRAVAPELVCKRLKCLVEFFAAEGTGEFDRRLPPRKITVDNFHSAVKSPADRDARRAFERQRESPGNEGPRFVAAAHSSVPYFFAHKALGVGQRTT